VLKGLVIDATSKRVSGSMGAMIELEVLPSFSMGLERASSSLAVNPEQ